MLQYADLTTNRVEIPNTAVIENLAAATILCWYRPNSVSNVFRVFMGKTANPGTDGWDFKTRAANGAALIVQRKRATTNMFAQSSAASLVAGKWSFIAAAFDTNAGTVAVYYGTQDDPAVDVTTSSSAGSGAPVSDSTHPLTIGNDDTLSQSLSGVVAVCGLWNVALSLDDLHRQQLARTRLVTERGCVGWWRPGANGRGVVFDESGTGLHGTLVGAVPISDTLPRANSLSAA